MDAAPHVKQKLAGLVQDLAFTLDSQSAQRLKMVFGEVVCNVMITMQ